MFQSKITRRLIGYFALALLVFAAIVGVVFALLSQKQSVDNHRNEITRYALLLAQASRGVSDSSGMMMGQGMGGYGAYVRFISQVSNTDIWVVDANGNPTTDSAMHSMMGGAQVNTESVPLLASTMLPSVLEGKTLSKDERANFFEKPTILVGTPIEDQGAYVGAVFMRSTVDGTNDAVIASLMLLLASMAVALVCALLLTVPLSSSFTKPLSSMRATALKLADNTFSARTGVKQRDEIGELASTLDILAERLEEASQQSAELDALRKDFIVTISHELRTPVTVMRGSLEALHDGVVSETEKVREYYETLLVEAKHLERLVNDLLELSRLQNAHFTIESQRVALSEILSDAVRSASRIAADKGVNLVSEVEELPIIEGDYGRLRQMLIVVLDNAIKFTPVGGEVKVLARNRVIDILDEGPGMSDEDIDHMFDRFYRHPHAGGEGTGLGLAIAHEIASRHHIDISATRRQPCGMLLRFTIA